jgi:hypothetical protein
VVRSKTTPNAIVFFMARSDLSGGSWLARLRDTWLGARIPEVVSDGQREYPALVRYLTAIVPIGIAALGGALMVFGAYDDSPGGTLIGLAIVLGAMVFGAGRVR